VGHVDGAGSSARFRWIRGLATDRTGTVFVTDESTVRRISPSGSVTTIAGVPGVSAYIDGPLLQARFSAPTGLAVAGGGDIFLVDHDVVRKISSAGIVTTAAGKNGVMTLVDGRGENARFMGAVAIAIDGAGDLWIAEYYNRIRRLARDGTVTTVAGAIPPRGVALDVALNSTRGAADGIGSTARFFGVPGITADRSGNVYIVDRENHAIRKGNAVNAVAAGAPVVLATLSSDDSTASYQWLKNGAPIPGATEQSYGIASTTAADEGDYAVCVSADGSAVESEPLKVAVESSRLSNLSIRSRTGAGAETLIVGFAVRGAGLPLLVRGIGPTLRQHGVSDPVETPRLALYAGESLDTSGTGWANSDDIAATTKWLGAFSLPAGGQDAAVLTVLDSGVFTVQCTATEGANGVALVELYDASTTRTCRLSNVSARTRVGIGEYVAIAGFSVSGSAPQTVLIRGVGPTLAQHGVADALADPQLQLFDGMKGLKAQNDNWADHPRAVEIAATAHAIGAFPLPTSDKDAALLVTLEPGLYSVHLSGVASSTGVALVEIYEVPSRSAETALP
jgi:hypothetical protein